MIVACLIYALRLRRLKNLKLLIVESNETNDQLISRIDKCRTSLSFRIDESLGATASL